MIFNEVVEKGCLFLVRGYIRNLSDSANIHKKTIIVFIFNMICDIFRL